MNCHKVVSDCKCDEKYGVGHFIDLDNVEFVCHKCFNNRDKCTCKKYTHDIGLDKNIIEHIKILNRKGYNTVYSCEGHSSGGGIYICFDNSFRNIPENCIPDGFVREEKNKAIRHLYNKVEKDFVNEKEKYLSILLEWCNSLEDLNNKVR
jgi:hypothetical protein